MSKRRPPKRPNRTLSRDDMALWHHVAGSVTPLRRRKGRRPEVELEEGAPTDPSATKAAHPAAAPSARPLAPLPSRQAAELTHGASPGVDKRTAGRLRKGRLPIEARLDLHGHTQEEAHRALNAFISGAQAAGRRCVLVVTGKGYRPDGTTGVLRQAVPRWLNQWPLRETVLSFTYAQPKDGGEGALYILLRRNR